MEDSNGALYVKSLVNGGSAALSGQIQVMIRHMIKICANLVCSWV